MIFRLGRLIPGGAKGPGTVGCSVCNTVDTICDRTGKDFIQGKPL